jgi:protocatechuate 3,4-dioxygenase beta subunit
MRLIAVLTLTPLIAWAQTGAVGVPNTNNPAAAHQAAPKETPPEDLCSLEGEVVNNITGDPIRKATLTLSPEVGPNATAPPTSYTTATDATGKFAMAGIEPGHYHFRVMRTGFVSTQYGARGPQRPGVALTLDRGKKLKDVDFRLTPHGVVTGRVVDEDSDPMPGVQVQLARFAYQQGRRQLAYVGGGLTDDRGDYRAYGVAPGKYFVSTIVRQMDMFGFSVDRSAAPQPDEDYVTTYYPGTASPANAVQIEVQPGGELNNVNFKLVKAHTVRVRGHVSQNVLSGRAQIMVSLMPRAGDPMSMMMSMNRGRPADAKGNFELTGVTAGQYYLRGVLLGSNRNYSGRVPVDVGNTHVDGVALTISAGATLKGRLTVDGDANQSLTNLNVRLLPRDNGIMFNMSNGKVSDDLTFSLEDVAPESYNLSIFGLPDGYYVKSIRYGETELPGVALDVSPGPSAPLTIRVSPNAGQITGTVQHPKTQQGAPGASVVLIPQEPDRKDQNIFYGLTSTDQFGNFTLKNLVPGDYKVFAWEDLEPGAYFDPEFVKPVDADGEKVSITEAGKHTLQVKLILAGAAQNSGQAK